MPHITLDYTDNLTGRFDSQTVLADLIEALAHLGVERNNVMCRAVRLTDWRVGDGDRRRAFVHLKLAFLDTRPAQFKQQVLAAIKPILAEAFAQPLTELILQINLEIRDLRADFYEKIVSQ